MRAMLNRILLLIPLLAATHLSFSQGTIIDLNGDTLATTSVNDELTMGGDLILSLTAGGDIEDSNGDKIATIDGSGNITDLGDDTLGSINVSTGVVYNESSVQIGEIDGSNITDINGATIGTYANCDVTLLAYFFFFYEL